ncbi:hypothetical protein DH09_20980 [Bacillaceae bacterium JMAK1]|nr:hypothetical protein DH09_20980 [Bacillaceae bacterium JMAK1]
MKRIGRILMIMLVLASALLPLIANAESEPEAKPFEKPDYVYNISRENTFENVSRELPYLEPAEFTSRLQDTSDVRIENPTLISMLNESNVKDSKVAFGVNASIYLGSWALSYDSEATEVNWEYERINSNTIDNRGGEDSSKLSFVQNDDKFIKGELLSPVPQQEDVQNMMRINATKKTSLPLTFLAPIGRETKIGPEYQVHAGQMGTVQGYVPAVHDQGTVTYGEVFLTLKGKNPALVVKNIEKQQVDAWIPVKDFVTLKYNNG